MWSSYNGFSQWKTDWEKKLLSWITDAIKKPVQKSSTNLRINTNAKNPTNSFGQPINSIIQPFDTMVQPSNSFSQSSYQQTYYNPQPISQKFYSSFPSYKQIQPTTQTNY